MDLAKNLSFLVLLLCLLITLENQNSETSVKSSFHNADYSSAYSCSLLAGERKLQQSAYGDNSINESLKYDYYRESCPLAEQIIRSTVQNLFNVQRDVAPALLRLFFHDCFIEGCDASVLLDPAPGIDSEKDSPPNQSLKGFDAIDTIKSQLEVSCSGIVSCADTLTLAAREAVLLVGGPFYPLLTGRKDSTVSYKLNATNELPTPDDDHSKAINKFASRGFDERETVSLLGAHSTGTIHCRFMLNRLHNITGRNGPDPSIDADFLEVLRSKCNSNQSPSSPSATPSLPPSSSADDPGMRMDYEGPGKGFGTVYYRSLLERKGLLFVDQQMTAGAVTNTWVEAFASDINLFHDDFGLSMIKLSNLKPLTAPMGQM
ncbi:hypothetical protein ACS0TY_035108 [Phlomoides rotata]